MTANLLLQDDMAPEPPRCWNREPFAHGRVRYGVAEETGEPVRVELRNDWFAQRCAIHDGRGIGPNGETYPAAHGWLVWCKTCRWNPGDGNG